MAKGRCAGCQATGTLSRIEAHIVDCPAWLALDRAAGHDLSPAAEHERWTEHGRADERAARRTAVIQENQGRRQKAAGRFSRSRDLTQEDLT